MQRDRVRLVPFVLARDALLLDEHLGAHPAPRRAQFVPAAESNLRDRLAGFEVAEQLRAAQCGTGLDVWLAGSANT